MTGNDKKIPPTNQQILEVAEGASKGVSDLSKLLAAVQQAADANAAKATSMLASISDNSKRIDGVEAKATKIEAEVEGNKGQISDCLRRIESLERRQRAAREIDDQERKIKILQRRISPQEIKRAATFVALHGLPLPREGSTEQELSTAIARMIAQALGSGLAEYIFSAKDQNFANISSWISLPGGGGHAYSRITPENAKNSIIFNTRTRIQAVHLESKIRGALISTQATRKSNEFSGLELGFYSDSPKIKALYKMLLYKGRLVTDAVEQLSNFRVCWRGGARRDDPASVPQLSLELKADKAYMSRREDYFFKDGALVRNVWTDDFNVLLSELPNIWFPRKPDQVQHAENRIQKMSTEARNNVGSPAASSFDSENPDKRKRESPGLAGNRPKGSHLDLDAAYTIEEEEETSSSSEEGDKAVRTKGKVTAERSVVVAKINSDETNEKNAEDRAQVVEGGDGFIAAKARRTRKDKTKNGASKSVNFPALPTLSDTSQLKISSVFPPTKKPLQSGLPVPKMAT